MSGDRRDSFAIGIDVGGTWIRIAAISPLGEVLTRTRLPLNEVQHTADGFLKCVCTEVDSLCAVCKGVVGQDRCTGVGVALPGILDSSSTSLARSVNLQFLEGAPLRSILQERLRRPVVLTTDAEACCWAEWKAHVPEAACFVHLRFGTGIGCAVARLGRVELLEREGTHHPNLLIVESGADALLCRCGSRGCLETIASGWAMPDVDRAARGSIQAMLNLAAHYQPEAICIGGGLLSHHPSFSSKIAELYAAKSRDMEGLPRLTNSRHGDDAGVLGAAYAALPLA